MNLLKYAVAALVFALTATAGFAQVITPQGRLTLQSGVPVMTGDASGSSIYYTPYLGNTLPVPNGSGGYTGASFSQLNLTLSTETSGNVYDVYAYYSGGWAICAGPEWQSQSSRGSSSPYVNVTQMGGLWVNASNMTCYNGPSPASVNAHYGIYLGSFYDSGNVVVNLKPNPTAAASNIIGIWNAYNRVPIQSIARDNDISWTISSSSWVPADYPSGGTRVTWLDGLEQTSVSGLYSVLVAGSGSGAFLSAPLIGIDLDSSTNVPDVVSGMTFNGSAAPNQQIQVEESFPPQMGVHYLETMNSVGGSASASATFYGYAAGGVQFTALIYNGEY